MKIRTGFVSNSSSSSFVVNFGHRPKTKDELRKMMFGTTDDIEDISYYEYRMPVTAVVDRVFDDLKKSRALTKKQIMEEIGSGYFSGMPIWRRASKEIDRIEAEFLSVFNEHRLADKQITRIYSDECKSHPLYEKYMAHIQKLRNDESDRRDQQMKKAISVYYEKIKHKFENGKNYRFSYADDGGEAVLEHGNIFRKLPHVQISHH